MIEILFRGKTLTNRWVEGAYYKQEYFYGDKEDAHVIITSKENLTYDQALEFCIVVPETVGQFTGLTDKNGKKIFDGDIVKFGDIIGIINYSLGCYCVKTNKPDWKGRNNPAIDIIFNEYPNEIEVIGNIHDNPELLKGGGFDA